MSKKKGYPTFDCHNRSYSQVEDELPNWLLLNAHNTPLAIITGNSMSMKTVVSKILEEYSMPWTIKYNNPGQIIVL